MEAGVTINKVTTSTSCSIAIVDSTTGYLGTSDTATAIQQFKTSEVKIVNVVKKNLVDDVETISTNLIDVATTDTVAIDTDGWYTVYHIIIPTDVWFAAAKAAGGLFNSYTTVYYTDGTNYYKYNNSTTTKVTIDEILEVNTTNTSLLRVTQDYFSIFYLIRCYIKIAEKLLKLNIKCVQDNLKELTFNRDVIWMAINIIKYLVESDNLAQAVVILNKIEYCNGLCKNVNNDTLNTSGCGCSS